MELQDENIRTTNVATALTRDKVLVGCNQKRVPVGRASLVAGAGEGLGFLCSGGGPWRIQDIKITTRKTTVRTVPHKTVEQ